jgi:hypothetical protein
MSPLKPQMLLAAIGAAIILSCFITPARAADSAEIRFESHQFKPLTLTVPTGQPRIVNVINASSETIEFESFKLNREKPISPGESTIARLPALTAGECDVYDDLHQNVPQGSIVAK